MRSWNFILVLEGFVALFSVLWPWVQSLDVSKYQTIYTRVTNIRNDFGDLEMALMTKLLDSTKALHVTLDANAGSGKWIVPLKYYNGIYIGDSCDSSSRSKWLCTLTTELILEGIQHHSKPSSNNLPILSGNDHSRLFWVAGGKLKIGHVVLEKGRSIYGGAALYILSNSIVNLFQVQLLRHTAKYAAAIYMEASGASSIINSTECTFKENLVQGGLQGGAIGIYGAGTNLVTLYNSTFTRNKFYAPNGRGQDVYKQSDSSILYDVINRYDKAGTLWGLRIVCPSLAALEDCIAAQFSQVAKDSGDCLCLPRVGEDVTFKPSTNDQAFVPGMIIDRNTNDWRGDGVHVPGLQKNVCIDQKYPQRGYHEKDTNCNFI